MARPGTSKAGGGRPSGNGAKPSAKKGNGDTRPSAREDVGGELSAFVGRRVGPTPPRGLGHSDDRSRYYASFMAESWEEAVEYHEYGAAGYDLDVEVSPDGVIEAISVVGEQCPHGARQFASDPAAFMFGRNPHGRVEWADIAPVVREEMVALLSALTATPAAGRP